MGDCHGTILEGEEAVGPLAVRACNVETTT